MNQPNLRLAYILIHLLMFLPVLLWPMPLLYFENPMLANSITPTWFLSISLLLITAVSLDSLLYGITSRKQAIDAMLWVSLFAMVIISALHHQSDIWMLAILFLIHALRSGYRLFMQPVGLWFLWLAWSRDILAALTILFWLKLW